MGDALKSKEVCFGRGISGFRFDQRCGLLGDFWLKGVSKQEERPGLSVHEVGLCSSKQLGSSFGMPR